MAAYGKTLRAVEVGTKAGWVLIAGLAALVLWNFLRPKRREGDIEEVVPLLPPTGAAGPGDAPEPGNQAPPQGVVGGSLISAVTAQIISPPVGGKVYRNPLSSKFDATIEVVNVRREVEPVIIEVVADYYEFAGSERLGVRTRFPARLVPRESTQRFEVEIDTGNFNGMVAEFGQANAVVSVFVNGEQAQSTSFEVW